MADNRVELSDGDWADLRHPNKIPHRRTLEYRDVFYQTAAGGAELATIPQLTKEEVEALTPEQKEERDKEVSAGVKSMVKSGVLKTMEDLSNALVLAVVSGWSFGDVNLDTLLDVPTADLKVIQEHCAGEEYVKVLTPDFDDKMDREPGSPT